MKFRFHWGWGIATFMVLFFLSIVVRIVISSNIEVDLIEKDYYHKELNYETDIQRVKNTNALSEKITLKRTADSLVFKFPDIIKNKQVTGKILFYCPSKTNRDQAFEIHTDSLLRQIFLTRILSENYYKIKINWDIGTTGYYQEFDVRF